MKEDITFHHNQRKEQSCDQGWDVEALAPSLPKATSLSKKNTSLMYKMKIIQIIKNEEHNCIDNKDEQKQDNTLSISMESMDENRRPGAIFVRGISNNAAPSEDFYSEDYAENETQRTVQTTNFELSSTDEDECDEEESLSIIRQSDSLFGIPQAIPISAEIVEEEDATKNRVLRLKNVIDEKDTIIGEKLEELEKLKFEIELLRKQQMVSATDVNPRIVSSTRSNQNSENKLFNEKSRDLSLNFVEQRKKKNTKELDKKHYPYGYSILKDDKKNKCKVLSKNERYAVQAMMDAKIESSIGNNKKVEEKLYNEESRTLPLKFIEQRKKKNTKDFHKKHYPYGHTILKHDKEKKRKNLSENERYAVQSVMESDSGCVIS